MIGSLVAPPGRRPSHELKELSAWFNGLSMIDRQHAERIIALVGHHAVFGFLCVLDGVTAIEDRSDKGALELRYRNEGVNVHLDDENGEFLHDIFNTR